MANDLSNPVTATLPTNHSHEGFFDHGPGSDSLFGAVQLAQADGAAPVLGQTIQVAPPQGAAGAAVIRVQVTPGSIVELPQPFDADAALAAKEGDGNLAIRVGDVTVILQGYIAAANDPEHPVTIEGADGKPIDVATILASTDPAIDIQTAAGPGDAGQDGQGADNTGAILAQLAGGSGLGGLNAVGGQEQTELAYSTIDGGLRQEFAQTTLGTSSVFGFSVGASSFSFGESVLRDPAQKTNLGSFDNFLHEYKDAVENPGNSMFGWADFQGTNATNGDFEAYLAQTSTKVPVDVNFTNGTGDLVLNGIADGVTSNGSKLNVDSADQGHTLFVRREDDDALVAVVHVEQTADGQFTIETILINRIDHPHHDTGEPGKDSMTIEVDFTVCDGPAPHQGSQEGEGTGDDGPQSPSIEGSITTSFSDDVPILEDVRYHNQHTEAEAHRAAVSTGGDSIGLIDEDWLKAGAHDADNDKGDDAGGGTCVTGCIKVDFGADGPAQTDSKNLADAGKHAFALDTGYALGQLFGALTSGGQPLKVLSISDNHLTVGIAETKQIQSSLDEVQTDETSAPTDPIAGCTIFTLTLNQDTGTFEFDLKGPLDHKASDVIFGDETGVSALVADDIGVTIPLQFGVNAYDDDGDWVQATINIDVNDDVPIARDDHAHIEKGSFATLLGDVMNAYGEDSNAGQDSAGADGAIVIGVAAGELTGAQSDGVGTVIQGMYGKLYMSGDGGKYSYTRDAGSPGGGDDQFTYTLKDGDGDTSTAVLTVHIDNACATITLPNCPADTTVHESGLPERNGEPAGTDAAANSDTTSGTITINAPDTIDTLQIGSTTLTLAQLNGLSTSTPVTIQDGTRGELVLTHFDVGSGHLDYTYNLLDNDLVSGDSTTASFSITVKDLDGSEGDATLSIKIVDDAPTANCDTILVGGLQQPTADVQFILDISGSMQDAHFNVPGNTYPDNGIGLERYAIEQMLTTHPEIQNVQVVLFDEHATHSVWMTAAAALDYVKNDDNFKGAGGNTNYDQALAESMDGFGQQRPLPQGDQTLVYFFSDGDPNQPGGQNTGINGVGNGSNVSTAEWEQFVTTNQISNVFAVGVGSISGSELNQLVPISYPNTDTAPTNHEDNFLNITSSDVSTLIQSLDHVITFPVVTVTSDVTGNDVTGADGFGNGKLVSVAYEANTFSFDPAHHGYPIDLGTGRGTLLIKEDGTYTYTSPSGKADGTPFYVEYTMQDGDGDQSTAKLKIDINARPETDLNGAAAGANNLASFTEQTPVLVAPAATVSDDGSLVSMTVTLANRPDGNLVESLALNPSAQAAAAGLTVNYDAPSGVLSITGSAPASTYQAILQGILYNNTSDAPDTTTRSVTVVVNDGTSDSTIHGIGVSVHPVNDAPDANIVPDSFAATEGADLLISGQNRLSVSDVDSGDGQVTVTLTVTDGELHVSKGNSGVDSVSGSGGSVVTIKGTVAEINALLHGDGKNGTGSVTFGDDGANGPVTLTLKVNDNGNEGSGGSKLDQDTATITINEKPVTDLNGSGKSGSDNSASFIEQTSIKISPLGTVKDDSGAIGSMTVTLTNRPDGNSTESLSLNPAGATAAAGLAVAYDTASGKLTITGPSTAATYQAILQNILYNNDSDTPNTANRTVTVVVNDGSSNSDSHSVSISVMPVNDAPIATITPTSFNAKEETGYILSGKGLSISDVDAGNGTMTVTLKVGEGDLNISKGTTGVTVSGSGGDTVTLSGTISQINKLLNGESGGVVEYLNRADTPSAQTTLTLKVDDNGNTGGGDLLSTDTAIIYIENTPEAPVACGDHVITNAGSNVFSIPEWALTYNDTDADTPNSNLDLISGAGAVFNASSKDTVGHTDGIGSAGNVSFTDGFNDDGSFDYKVTDGSQQSTGHVTVTQDTGTITGWSGDDIVVVYGSTAATVNAGDGNDIVLGGGGNDTLNGESGNDLIYGGGGNDKMDGGSGNDLIFGQAGDDTMIFTSTSNSAGDKFDGGDGFDRVLVSNNNAVTVTYEAAKFLNVEMIDLGDASNRSGNGSQHSLSLSAADLGVHNYGTISGHQISLFVIGDTNGNNSNSRDDVALTGFTNMNVNGNFTDTVTGASHNFDLYKSSTDANIVVAVEHNLG